MICSNCGTKIADKAPSAIAAARRRSKPGGRRRRRLPGAAADSGRRDDHPDPLGALPGPGPDQHGSRMGPLYRDHPGDHRAGVAAPAAASRPRTDPSVTARRARLVAYAICLFSAVLVWNGVFGLLVSRGEKQYLLNQGAPRVATGPGGVATRSDACDGATRRRRGDQVAVVVFALGATAVWLGGRRAGEKSDADAADGGGLLDDEDSQLPLVHRHIVARAARCRSAAAARSSGPGRAASPPTAPASPTVRGMANSTVNIVHREAHRLVDRGPSRSRRSGRACA